MDKMKFENLIELINAVSESELTGFQYEENDVKIKLSKKEDKVQVVSAAPFAGVAGFDAAQAGCMANAGVQAGYAANAGAGNAAAPAASEAADNSAETAGQKLSGKIVESPLVGTFYAAPSEDAAPFVSVGDTVKKGQTLAIVEAMKLMNEIESEYDGVIEEVLVENGQAVEYGQPLFVIR